jgi:uncharacterized protein YjiS (DUF1127 family)
MSANYPVLPIAGGALARAFLAVVALVRYWLKELMRVRRHRREARLLAGLDRHMLADIGITRSDLRDAFSEPFWEDPTVLLRERAGDRRHGRKAIPALPPPDVKTAFCRQTPNRLPRYSL